MPELNIENNILIIVEQDDDYNENVLGLLACANKIQENFLCGSNKLSLLIAGEVKLELINKLQNDVLRIINPEFTQINIYTSNCSYYKHGLAENITELIIKLHHQENFNWLLAAHSTFGKNIMPRVAAKLDISQLSDLLEIQGNKFLRSIYAGNALILVELYEKIKILTVRTSHFNYAFKSQSKIKPNLINLDWQIQTGLTKFVDLIKSVKSSNRPELNQAKIVIAGGRGVQNKENFNLIFELADLLNAGVGATRAAVDAGFVPNDYQIGQTGKIIAPDIYIAIGISGAIQHIAGIQDAKVIIAINRDPDAPIFQIADYGLVGDLFEIIPDLINLIKQNISK